MPVKSRKLIAFLDELRKNLKEGGVIEFFRGYTAIRPKTGSRKETSMVTIDSVTIFAQQYIGIWLKVKKTGYSIAIVYDDIYYIVVVYHRGQEVERFKVKRK